MKSIQELERIASLIIKERKESLTDDESAELTAWQNANPGYTKNVTQLFASENLPETLNKLIAADLAIRKRFQELNIDLSSNDLPGQMFRDPTEDAPRTIFKQSWHRLAWFRSVAAAVIFSIGVAVWVAIPDNTTEIARTEKPIINNVIKPGGDRAILILEDGSTIDLDNAATGDLSGAGDVRITKLPGGQLRYGSSKQHDLTSAKKIPNHKIVTPNGGQYSIVLPDGSKAWLNAASSITFPAVFDGSARRIAVTGEVYFEVLHDDKRPFIADVNNRTSVQVLGTHFNINAYNNEPAIKTTLLEGKVKVTMDQNAVTILPGEQAIVDENVTSVKNVDTDAVMAWKNGLFDFDNADIPTLMHQLERWYDIHVKYTGKLPAVKFKGKMYRNENLNTVLEFLSEYGLHFDTRGRTVIISPKK